MGDGKRFSYAEGGGKGTKCIEVVLTQELDVLAILKGGTTSFRPIKRGGGAQRILQCLEEEGAPTKSRPKIFQFCSPPPS